MKLRLLFPLIAMLVSLASCHRQIDVVDTWAYDAQSSGQAIESPPDVASLTLVFRDDMTFTGLRLTRVWEPTRSKVWGTFTREGDVITLTGKLEGGGGFGHHNEPIDAPFTWKLRVEQDKLTAIGGTNMPARFVFRRKVGK